jgi:hypothetical protein
MPIAGHSIHRQAYRCRLKGLGAPSIAGREQIIDDVGRLLLVIQFALLRMRAREKAVTTPLPRPCANERQAKKGRL